MTKPFDQVLYDVHGNYRARKIEYTPPEQWVDDSLTWPLLQFHLIRILPLFLCATAFFFLGILLSVLSAIGGLFTSGSGTYAISTPSPFGGLSVLCFILAVLLYIASIVTLFLPYREPMAEYSLLIEGRGGAARSSYWWIWSASRQRQTPYQVRPAKLAGQYFLTIKHGRDQVVMVVREVGADLFVGWNMWRSRSTVVVIGHYFRDMFANFGPGASFRSSLRNSHTRALRETGHSLLREGVQAAIYGISPGSDTLDRDLAGIPDVEQMLGAASGPALSSAQVPQSQVPQNQGQQAQNPPAGYPQQGGGAGQVPPGYSPPAPGSTQQLPTPPGQQGQQGWPPQNPS
ncbi:hypothetical protein GCM10009765_17950 [Fodinicola feengrottensis]|uniref:Uncharacterized protein n=1 Tax=Fodinicola feengrottensis TaxID=435914 RepID=A0ABN2GCR8_9ACTN